MSKLEGVIAQYILIWVFKKRRQFLWIICPYSSLGTFLLILTVSSMVLWLMSSLPPPSQKCVEANTLMYFLTLFTAMIYVFFPNCPWNGKYKNMAALPYCNIGALRQDCLFLQDQWSWHRQFVLLQVWKKTYRNGTYTQAWFAKGVLLL